MRRLILMRHAKSDWSSPGQPDRLRPLNARGRTAAPLMGAYLDSHRLTPDFAVVSPATRALQTWDLVAPALKAMPAHHIEEGIYANGVDGLVLALRAAPSEARSLLLIGHNPSLQMLATELSGSGDPQTRERIADKFPTAAIAIIDFAVDDWADVRPQGGRLVRFVTPRMLQAASD